MKISIFFQILLSYKKVLIQLLFFEFFYLLRGYKQNSIEIFNNDRFTDNIPCPYFFLQKIIKFILKSNIKSLLDLGCGGGRALYFFNEKLKINYYGIEYQTTIYENCKKLFQKDDNIKIFNEDFMSFEFLKLNNDCYFINDPLKKKDDLEKLIIKILDLIKKNGKIIYFILINLDDSKRKIFNEYKLIEFYQINSKGYYIYSSEKNQKNN